MGPEGYPLFLQVLLLQQQMLLQQVLLLLLLLLHCSNKVYLEPHQAMSSVKNFISYRSKKCIVGKAATVLLQQLRSFRLNSSSSSSNSSNSSSNNSSRGGAV